METFLGIPDEELNLVDVLLDFAALRHGGISLERYKVHFDVAQSKIEQRYDDLITAGADDDAGTRLAAMHDVMVLGREYRGIFDADADPMVYADLIEVVERRAGFPMMLSALYAELGRRLGWSVYALSIGGRYVCRVDFGGERLIFDPSRKCQLLQAHDLRDILKQVQGEEAELYSYYFDPVASRDLVMRIQNIIKIYQIQMEDYDGALATVQAMQAFDPSEYRLLLDAGILYARSLQPEAAIFALERYLAEEEEPRARHEALKLLNDLREKPE